MKIASEAHALLTGVVLGSLSLMNNDRGNPAGVTAVECEYDAAGSYQATINVTAGGDQFQVVIIPAPLVIDEESMVK